MKIVHNKKLLWLLEWPPSANNPLLMKGFFALDCVGGRQGNKQVLWDMGVHGE